MAVHYQPEAQPHTVPQQEISQVPVVLQWPTVFIPMNCTPVTLSPQMMIALSWDPCQPVTIPCLLSNVVLLPCITTASPVLPAQVLLPETSIPGPKVCTQLPDASNLVPEVCTQLPGISNQGALSAEVDRQKELDAAEALLLLHNSPQAWEETCSGPGPDGE
ncbi:1700031F05Rik [Phodopus roborovskii]|uniref:1700031F05Rik protein n=1 Tax=Phodopus roborovskii TaxID=109678 RepID=A0AAU9Z043_PHORO|nr:1700031F05Rik [Phodopus roborovskii]